MYEVVGEHIFPLLRTLGGNGTTYAHHMKDARLRFLLRGSLICDQVPMEERDTKGDLYEYMLAKIATAGQNGQFRTPAHHPADGRDGRAEAYRRALRPGVRHGWFSRCRAVGPPGIHAG